MSTAAPSLDPYSADVRMKLVVGDKVYNVASAGPTRVIVRDPANLSPCDAELIIAVDGRPSSWLIRLSEGAVSSNPEIAIQVLQRPSVVSA